MQREWLDLKMYDVTFKHLQRQYDVEPLQFDRDHAHVAASCVSALPNDILTSLAGLQTQHLGMSTPAPNSVLICVLALKQSRMLRQMPLATCSHPLTSGQTRAARPASCGHQ